MSSPALSTGPAEAPDETVSLWRDAWRRLIANRLAVFGLAVVALLILVALVGPWLTPYDFLSQDINARNQAPSLVHWFGTDDLGRDVLSRVIYGARTALLVAIVVTGIALSIGVLLGAVAGYAGGRVDAFIMWLTDIAMSVPSLLLVVVINTSLKPPLARWMDAKYLETLNPVFRETVWIDFVLVFGSMALILWPPYARLIRAQVLSIRSRNYVTAARALGLPAGIVIRRYIVPNALGPVIVAVSAGLGNAMVLESAFSFLGVGVTPPTPSWGNMISDGLRVWRTYPHLLAAPAAVLGLATIAFSFLGDGLNDALNPKQWRK
ncbi:ABC transporter permease [Prosthecomicrobium pneumaticum]|uniref:Peptide/nickel transport system permease protein n=1 Tax=Prosthecomicrobium pneumaticum TaxID=81895 RepID=A0A7W9FJT9_9HYPH|nr:ABC transporter permease [Prosthecomicrobium pneumaticum]MBB5751840.1 peptide/nickel transport system permease protein [Prosthecomicrobium pneumaticum]